MKDCRVVTSAKSTPDLRQAVFGQFLGESHGDLAGPDNRPLATFGYEIGNADPVVGRNGALDVLKAYQPLLKCDQVLECSFASGRLMGCPVNRA